MDLEFAEEQKMVQRNVRAFMEKEIIPFVDEYDRKGITKEELKLLVKKLIPLGYVTGPLPEKYGGVNLDPFSVAILTEEAARAWYLLSSTVNSITLIAERLMYLCNEAQRERFIPPLLSGDKVICTGNSEPNSGSDVRSIETTAVRSGNYYIINGTKIWSSRGMLADYCLLMAVTDKSKGSHGGFSHFLVDKKESPFNVRPINLLGLRGLGMAELSFEDCKVPVENLLGSEEGVGYKKQMALWTRSRTKLALEAVGVGQAAIDASIKYAQSRKQFGRPIGSFQLVQNMIVDMAMSIEAARWLSYRALYLSEKGQRCITEACMAKTFAVESCLKATANAVEIHGAYGLSDDCPAQRYYRDARCITMPEGTLEINRLMIGRELLGINAIYPK